jgi:hypothetical protein
MNRHALSITAFTLFAGFFVSSLRAVEKSDATAAYLVKPPPAVITTESLLDDMTNLSRLMEFPSPAYTTVQSSSYDRASKTPDDHNAWFGNKDWGQWIRMEERNGHKEGVMMDADGPGAIVRIWSANPDKAGKIRIYIDNAESPTLETDMTALLGGKYPGLPEPISATLSAGWNLYFPIPYAKHCKVTSDAGEFYYHVNYRTYEPGTKVESFKSDQIEHLTDLIQAIAKRLSDPRVGGAPPADRVRKRFEATLAPDEQITLSELDGPRAICGLLFRLTADNLPAAARAIVLSLSFDGERTVECPLGDYYASAALVSTASLPLGITDANPQDLWSHWWMPFKNHATVSLKNLGTQTVKIAGGVSSVPYEWNDRSLLFHAKWRIERDIPGRPMTDWTHLQAQGKGRFVGGALHVINYVRDWWGEGDEKIYVDGEKFPSFFGTGSEDYYGYAWCSPARFVHAYHAQPLCQGPGNYGNTYVSRFHIIDDIPYTKSFKFDLENWHGSDKKNVKTTRAAVSYWYARPGGSDFFKPITREDVRLDIVPEYKVEKVKNAIEGESLKVLEKKGTVEIQELGGEFSGERQLWWQEAQPGDKLVLGFDAPSAVHKHVLVRLTKAADYGKVQLLVNDQKAGDVIDLYHDGITRTHQLDLGEFEIKKGPNTLTVEIVGANEKAIKAYMFGIDYLVLR